MSTAARAIITGLSFVFIFLSGIWLSRTGRPLHVGLSTIHKLISLGAGIFLLTILHQRSRVVPLTTTEWIAIVVTGLCFLGNVVSGGLLSTDKPMPTAVLSTAATLTLVLGR
jgi:hypothetical protein